MKQQKDQDESEMKAKHAQELRKREEELRNVKEEYTREKGELKQELSDLRLEREKLEQETLDKGVVSKAEKRALEADKKQLESQIGGVRAELSQAKDQHKRNVAEIRHDMERDQGRYAQRVLDQIVPGGARIVGHDTLEKRLHNNVGGKIRRPKVGAAGSPERTRMFEGDPKLLGRALSRHGAVLAADIQ